MNILVTVGSSSFDSLIKDVDNTVKSYPHCHTTFQIGSGSYTPVNGEYFSFAERFSEYLANADLIITHAGAGTVFELLEMGKKCIVVPNVERVDKHQSDLAQYITEHNFALVCHNTRHIAQLIEQAPNYQPNTYRKEPFLLADELIQLF